MAEQYVAPFVDAAGLHIPTYAAILNRLLTAYQGIYTGGAYLANDSADYQEISILSLALTDAMQALQLAYANRSPATGIGSALDSLVKLCGLVRKVPSPSTCGVTLTGTPSTVVTGGVVGDVNGYAWALPSPVTLPAGGTITVTAICQTLGAITALVGNLSSILTPTAGWTSVTNGTAATPGQVVETDAQLRARQALSAALPSSTRLAGTIAAIAALEGVTRWNVLENLMNVTDSNGLISHSIWAVVEGGTDLDVATAIFGNKGPGCGVNGTTSVNVTDPYTALVTPIKFSRPTPVPIYVSVGVYLFSTGTTAMLVEIQTAVKDYLNSLAIGAVITVSGLYAAAMSVMPSITAPAFSLTSLTLGTSATPTGTADLVLAFNHTAAGVTANIVVTQQTTTP